ncbi:MAG TPA: protein kinase, partial [Bacteroidota bacterium]|nr:protein kinase [Bacteroidota bacterium]
MDELIGTTISHYEVLEKLGEGGIGAVYKALDHRLNRFVAVKTLLQHHPLNTDARTQLINEARSAASLNHPNIATVYSIEEVDRKIFIIMEFLEGEELKARIAREPVPVESALRIGLALSKGLKAAHARGIVHRDIKSSNVMLTNDGQAKILDFGLAQSASGETSALNDRFAGGTMPYMSPEQISGLPLDERTDLFSLGVVLYESMTGLLPFAGDHEPALVYSILNSDPRPVTDIDPSIPSAVWTVIARCLTKNREERYSSCDALIADIQACLREGMSVAPAGVRGSEKIPQLVADDVEPGELAGRRNEMEILLKGLEDARSGRGSTVFLAGELGAGKTRLASVLLSAAREGGMHVLFGRCIEGAGSGPYEPFVDALKRAFRQTDSRLFHYLTAPAGRGGRDLVSRLPLLTSLVDPGSGSSGGASREQVWEACLVLLNALSEDRPLVFFVDDLQWADEATLGLCSYLARNVTPSKIFFLAAFDQETAHAGEAPVVPLARRLSLEGKLQQIQLERMEEGETALMIGQILGGKVDQLLCTRIHGVTQGNALFTMELLSLLRARQVLKLSNARWTCDEGDLSVVVTERIQDVIRHRLDGLSARDMDILNIASCEPDYFESDLLMVSMQVTRIDLLKRLQILEDEYGVIRHDKKRYMFDHPLLRQVVYGQILDELREEYHRMIGAWLIDRYGNNREFAGRIARHLLLSGQEREAVPFLLIGADLALSVWAVDLAKADFSAAGEILRRTGGENADFLLRIESGLGDVSLSEGNTEEALQRYARVCELARQAGNRASEVTGMRKHASALRITGDLAGAITETQSALRMARELKDVKEEILCNVELASIHAAQADYAQTVLLGQQALDRAVENGDTANQALSMSIMGLAQWHLGSFRKAGESLGKALRMYSSVGNSQGRATVLNFLGLTYHCLAELEKALEAHRESLTIKRALADGPHIPGSLNNIGDTYREIGDMELALQYHRDALESARHQHNRASECDSLRDLGRDYFLTGELDRAGAHYEEALRLSRTYGFAWYEVRAMLSLAELSLARGDRESAEKWSSEGVGRSKEIGADQLTLEAGWTRGKVVAQYGDAREARLLLVESAAKAESMDHQLFLWQILHDIVMLERSAGQKEAEDRETTQVRALLDRILGGFKNRELKMKFRSMKEVCDLLGDPG